MPVRKVPVPSKHLAILAGWDGQAQSGRRQLRASPPSRARRDPSPRLPRFKELVRYLDHVPRVRACLWTRLGSGPTPVFAIERGHEVLDHLIEWSEGDPSGWFHLHIIKARHRYHIVLMPNLARSLERYSLARMLLAGHWEATPSEYVFLFHPLAFTSRDRGLIEQIELREQMQLGIVDWAEVNLDQPERLPEPTFIGPFEVKSAGLSDRRVPGRSG
jgi:hypothetical protein